MGLLKKIYKDMNTKDKAKELGDKYARQYQHNNSDLTGNNEFVFSNEEITMACLEMANIQKQVDIKKAWGWILSHTNASTGDMGDFIKTMEEEL